MVWIEEVGIDDDAGIGFLCPPAGQALRLTSAIDCAKSILAWVDANHDELSQVVAFG